MKHDTKIAGVIAYYPFCYEGVDPSVPTLILIGDKDDWTPAAACEAVKSKPNVEVVVYPGDTHGFVYLGENGYFLGHHLRLRRKGCARRREARRRFHGRAHEVRRAKISGPAVKSGGLSVIKMADVCVGSLADIKERISDVRFTPRKQTFCSAQKEFAMCQKQT